MAEEDVLPEGVRLDPAAEAESLRRAALKLAREVSLNAAQDAETILSLRERLRAYERGSATSHMPDERDTLWKELADLRQLVQLLETRLDGKVEALAPRDWVHTVLNPLQQSVTRMEAAVSQLTQDAKELFDTHKEMLREKGEREKQEWAEKTPLGLVKKYAPVVGALVGLVALFRVLGTLVEIWLRTINVGK